MASPGINHAGLVQGALLTWEILAHFAVGSISLFFILFEKTPFQFFLRSLQGGKVKDGYPVPFIKHLLHGPVLPRMTK